MEGEYTCCYCREPCASDSQFYIYLSNDTQTALIPLQTNAKLPLYFCTPECAAGYNRYMSNDPKSEQCGNRHRFLEKRHQRKIVCAPPPQLLAHRAVPRSKGMLRNVWLWECRQSLSKEDQMRAQAEMFQPQTLSERMCFHK